MPYMLLPDSYEDLFRRAQELAYRGERQEAIELYSRLVEKLVHLRETVLARRPELRDMQLQGSLQLSELLQAEGRFREAIAVQERLLQTHPDHASVWRRNLALLRVAAGEVDRGLGELQAVAEQDPEDVWTWMALGNEARIEGRHTESQPAWERALEAARRKQDPKLLGEVLYGQFLLFQAMGRIDDALAAWEASVSSEPSKNQTVREVYQMLTEAGRYAQALEYVARDDNELQAGFQRGLIAHLTGDSAKAQREWKAVAAMDPLRFTTGHDCWVEAVLRLGDPQPVLERMPALLREHGTIRLLILSGIAWAMRGERERAQASFQHSINLLRHGRPPKQKLDGADWRLLSALVPNDELKGALKPYFAVVETLWG